MGKINKKNIRNKAKTAVAAAKNKAQEIKAQLNREKRATSQDQLLHKTITPKKNTKKKDKFVQKHKKLLNRFAQQRKERKEETARKNREKTAIIGDLHPLRDALPSLDEIYKLITEKKSLKTGLNETPTDDTPEKLSVKQKIKQKREQFVKRVVSYEKLLKDKNFKQNPREIIAAHIRNKYKLMEEE